MSTPRFIAFVRTAAPDARAQADALIQGSKGLGLKVVFEAERVTVLATPDTPVISVSDLSGVVLGAVFERGHSCEGAYRRAQVIEASEQICADLIQSHWGAYVAFLVDRSRSALQILRDPSGSLGCFRGHRDDVEIVYSDVETAHALGLVVGQPDPSSIAHHLTFQGLRVGRTALAGVDEVLPGTSVTFDGRGAASAGQHWSPWTFARREVEIHDSKAAAEQVGAEARRCVAAWADQYPSILHELSGGLDSSIVAACLADHGSVPTCITFVTPDPGADERTYARLVAERIGARLDTLMLDVADSNLDALGQAITARPGSGMLHQVLDKALTREGARTGAQVFFSGGGGDNVFCYLNTAAPAADAFCRHGLGRLLWQSIADLAALHSCSTWRAGQLALRKVSRPLRSWPQDVNFLAKEAPPRSHDPHPWLKAPPEALHGKHEQIISLMAVQNPLSSQASHGLAPVCYPLLSQPLVELCLRIPSWMWIAGGRNRAIARDAFAARLPPAIVQRRTKGDFLGLSGALYDKHREALTDVLLDGWLASRSLLDREALEAYLRSAAPVTDYRFHRVMELANVEVWARSWAQRPTPRLAR